MKFKKIIKIIIWLILILGIIIVIGLIRRKYSTQTPPNDGIIQNFREFLPFGRSNPTPTEESPTEFTPPTEEPEEEVPITRIRQISFFPVTGAGIFTKSVMKPIETEPLPPNEPVSTTTNGVEAENNLSEKINEYFVRYVNRATGYVYQNNLEEQSEKRITDTLLPKTGEVIFGNNSESSIFRYVEDGSVSIRSYLTSLPEILEGGDGNLSLEGEFLPDNIIGVTVSPAGDKLFYLIETPEGSVGVVSDIDGDNKKTIWTFPFTEWLVDWHKDDSILLTTKPSALSNGFVYSLNPQTGSLKRVLGDKLGLTALSDSSGINILYSFIEDRNVTLVLLNTETGEERIVPFSTLPEKCTFNSPGTIIYCAVPSVSPQGSFPDLWYRGQVSFNDSIWSIETKTNSIKLIADIEEESGQFMDIINPFLDPEEKYLLFTNKKNGTLWSISL